MRVQFLYSTGCPHAEEARNQLGDVLSAMACDSAVEEICVESEEQARGLGFLGSPSIRIDSVDLEGQKTTGEGALTCRLYGAKPVPPRWLVEVAVLRALKPGHLLFLCVANSARSQMAEGLFRHLGGDRVEVFSAGSEPAAAVHPLAVRAMAEISVDISAHRPKSLADFLGQPFDYVVAVCSRTA